MTSYDILGNIALVKFPRRTSEGRKKALAKALLQEHKNIKTVLEKKEKISGRLRTTKTRFILGVNTKEVLYHENGCVFRFNVEKCYFSPRLSSERAELARMVKKGESVLVMFGGVGPFAVVIAKTRKPEKVISVELGKIPSRYAALNAKANKVNVEVVQGDVKRILPQMKEKFDRVIMTRPNLEEDFLDAAFRVVKKGTIIHYYGFYDENDIGKLTYLLMKEAKKSKKKVDILNIKKAGDIGVRRYRYRADVLVS